MCLFLQLRHNLMPAHLRLSAFRYNQKPTQCRSRSVSISAQLLSSVFPSGTSGVLLPITTRLKWKKACLSCLELLNQDDLNLWGHTACMHLTGGGQESDKWPAVGRSYEAPEIETMCAVLQKSDSPRRCVQKIQPETSGGQTLSHSYWFLCKQVSLLRF